MRDYVYDAVLGLLGLCLVYKNKGKQAECDKVLSIAATLTQYKDEVTDVLQAEAAAMDQAIMLHTWPPEAQRRAD